VSRLSRRRARTLAIIASAFALLAFAPGALAATLNVDLSGNVVYTAAAGKTSVVAFDQVDADTVEVTQAVSQGDDDTITPDGTNCVVDATGTDNTFTCDNVTGNVIATGLDNNDTFDASGDYTGDSGLTDKTANFDGGDGNDTLNGGQADDTIHGGNGDDQIFGDFGGPGAGSNDTLSGDAGDDFVAGGKGNDTIDGGADGDSQLVGGPGNDTINGGDGNEGFIAGGPGDDTLNGGAGDDDMYGDCDGSCGIGGPGNDTMDGGAGNDSVRGEGGNDIVNGGAGDDFQVAGGPGNDTVDGGDGTDGYVPGGPGDDVVSGGAGDDYVVGDCGGYNDCGNGADGNDSVTGGSGDDFSDADGGTDTIDLGNGFDTVAYPNRVGSTTNPVSVTLDGAANDGAAGENDNVLNTEDVQSYSCCGNAAPGGATIVGNAGTNSLQGADGNDTIDGGAGNDFLYGHEGDDTINANDGFADRVSCGPGNDTANVDEFDTVSDDCEVVNRTTRGNLATEDAPPTVAWTTPASAAKLSSSAANNLAVTASDDKGVSKVVFLAGERIICTDTAAPYTCDYKPTDADVGRTTLTAIAYDTSQQTASAIRVVTVPRFKPSKVTSTTTPKTDATAPFTFTTKGRISLPSGVSKGAGCAGTVAVTFKAGKKTISTRKAKVTKSCTFRSKVTFSLPSRLHPKTLRVQSTFRGNAVLTSRASARKQVKVSP
jgi:Ca2+-binding RTX toxin-like protein